MFLYRLTIFVTWNFFVITRSTDKLIVKTLDLYISVLLNDYSSYFVNPYFARHIHQATSAIVWCIRFGGFLYFTGAVMLTFRRFFVWSCASAWDIEQTPKNRYCLQHVLVCSLRRTAAGFRWVCVLKRVTSLYIVHDVIKAWVIPPFSSSSNPQFQRQLESCCLSNLLVSYEE